MMSDADRAAIRERMVAAHESKRMRDAELAVEIQLESAEDVPALLAALDGMGFEAEYEAALDQVEKSLSRALGVPGWISEELCDGVELLAEKRDAAEYRAQAAENAITRVEAMCRETGRYRYWHRPQWKSLRYFAVDVLAVLRGDGT